MAFRTKRSRLSQTEARLQALKGDFDALQRDMRLLLDAVGVEAGQRVTAATNGAAHQVEEWASGGVETVRGIDPHAAAGGDCVVDERRRGAQLFAATVKAMHLGSGVLLRAVLFAAAVGLTWIGVGFLAYGVYLSLIPSVGVSGAAFIAALICLVVGGIILAALFVRAPQIQVEPRVAAVDTPVVEGGSMIKALSELAQDHPLMAVACAAILGATNGGDGVKRRR